MKKFIKPPTLKLSSAQKLLRNISVTCLLVTCGATTAFGDDKNYATQLELKNCGGYLISPIQLERKQGEDSWEKVKSYDLQSNGGALPVGQAFCLDVSAVTSDGEPLFAAGDQARLRAHISGGSTVNCDGTNYGTSSDGKNRRVMEMKGTTLNNNGCNSKGYKSNLSSQSCSGAGVVIAASC